MATYTLELTDQEIVILREALIAFSDLEEEEEEVADELMTKIQALGV